jgi:26S proteasome non-ATPase regulatory subunit 10
MINLLIKHRSPINATDSAGQTPLHHAVAEGHGKSLSLNTRHLHVCLIICGEGDGGLIEI